MQFDGLETQKLVCTRVTDEKVKLRVYKALIQQLGHDLAYDRKIVDLSLNGICLNSTDARELVG